MNTFETAFVITYNVNVQRFGFMSLQHRIFHDIAIMIRINSTKQKY
jgi:hypothetical protein